MFNKLEMFYLTTNVMLFANKWNKLTQNYLENHLIEYILIIFRTQLY